MDYSLNTRTCICENIKYLKSVADTSVTKCDEIVIVMDIVSTRKTNTIATDVTSTDFHLDNILIDKISNENNLIYNISYTAQKMNVSIKVSSVNLTNRYATADLAIFTEESLNGKLYFCSVTENFSCFKISAC